MALSNRPCREIIDDYTSIQQAVFAQVARQPSALAIQERERSYSYSDLYQLCCAIAEKLQPLETPSEAPVGVYLPRDVRLPAALLAIMSVQGAYLPLDPKHPSDRTAQILSVAHADHVITTKALAVQLPDYVDCVFVDDLLNGQFPITQETHQSMSQLAYFIFTSGSTGVPKGVMIEQGNAMALLKWGVCQYTEDDLAQVAAGTSITFDLSVFELFVPLIQGGCIHLLEDSLSIGDWPHRSVFTLINTVPSVAQELVEQNALPASVRIINLAGEPLSMSLVQRIRQQCSSARLFNLYGPSEDTTYSTGGEIFPDDTVVTIGQALTGRSVHVLDAKQQPVENGEVGEIYVSGPGVARGYFQRPDLNELFQTGTITAHRSYRTGDFGKWLPDGRLVYLGRKDDQIKVRGHRIELGEVEAVIRQSSIIDDVAVIVENSDQTGATLKAVMTLTNDSSINEAMGWVASQLPDYMVPRRWCVVDEFPRLPNGKKDRKALKKLGFASAERSGSKPSSLWEKRLANIWQHVLGMDSIFCEDHFIALGGHSLLMARFCHLARQQYQIHVHPSNPVLQESLTEVAQFFAQQTVTCTKPVTPAQLTEPVNDVLCSPSQTRFWTLEKLLPDSPRYNIPVAYMISGELDIPRLNKALYSLVDRHPVLTARFRETMAGLKQIRSAAADDLFTVTILEPGDRVDSWETAQKSAEAFARQPFHLQNEAPFRALLMTDQNSRHILVLVTHHIAVDGSLPTLLHDLSHLYDPQTVLTDNRPLDYLTYCQNQSYQTPFDQLPYWQSTLSNFPKPLELPSDVTPSEAEEGAGRLLTITLPTELSVSLQQFSQAQGVTLFHTLLAITWTYLARANQVDDLAITVPVDTRLSEEYQNSVGNFVNTVILRGDLRDQDSFNDILVLARTRTLEAIQHSQLPYEVILEQAVQQRDEQGRPVLNTMMSLVNSEVDVSLGSALCVPITVDLQTARFDLGIFFKQHGQGIDLQLEYATDVFSDLRACQIGEQWQILAKALLTAPAESWRVASLLSPEQTQRVIHRWNATQYPVLEHTLIHDAFVRQAQANPDHIAIRTASSAITYGELRERVNRIATVLAATDLPVQSRVAVLMERSPDVIASILAIVNVGMIYVPFDPANPVERFQKMIAVADIQAIVTDDEHTETGQHLVAHSSLDHQIVVNDQSLPSMVVDVVCPCTIQASDLAYIIFTSGTTGTPKAVAIQHDKAVNLIDWVNRTFHVGAQDVLLFVTSIAFDLSVYDMFGILSSGGCIRLASSAECQDPSRLAQILTDEHITFWDSAPIAFEQCLPYVEDRTNQSLRLVFLSGDWVPVNLPERMSASFVDATMVALGGATEATIWSNYHLVEPVDSTRRSIPYGKPIQNARYYILDSHLQPVPVGFAGDLYIAGGVLAAEYYGDAEKTADKFISDPFVSGDRARMYRTGDCARYFPDGTIEFLGREDSQVKIRGYRVETGEIEAALLSIPEVQGAHVRVVGEKNDRWLCAYLVYRAGHRISELTVRHTLRERVPEYMVPARFFELAALPMTNNGKFDARALPDPDTQSVVIRQPESNSLEGQLSSLWRQLLHRESITRHDNFFDLGGNSRLLIQMHQHLTSEFGFTFPIVKLFQYTTVSALTEFLLSLNDQVQSKASGPATENKVQPNRLLAQRRLRNKTVKDN